MILMGRVKSGNQVMVIILGLLFRLQDGYGYHVDVGVDMDRLTRHASQASPLLSPMLTIDGQNAWASHWSVVKLFGFAVSVLPLLLRTHITESACPRCSLGVLMNLMTNTDAAAARCSLFLPLVILSHKTDLLRSYVRITYM